jgi:cysteine desulfurase family protein (TIGR01976 family)
MIDNKYPIQWIRDQFPALKNDFIYSDNAAGTQLPRLAIQSMNEYLTDGYSLGGSTYKISQAADDLSKRFRREFADFIGATNSATLQFGVNATSMFRLLSVAIDKILEPGDEIIVSSLDHEANITPWLWYQKKGIKIKYWNPRGPERMLVSGDLRALISDRTRFVMVTGASNVLGTLTDLKTTADIAHEAGARLVVDAVHLAPHCRINVSGTGIDALVVSGYKLFGPKIALLYVTDSLFPSLPSLNHFFIDGLPFEIGAPNYEAMAAFLGVFSYLRKLAEHSGLPASPVAAMEATEEYERELTEYFFDKLQSLESFTIFGINTAENLVHRLPTFAIRHEKLLPQKISEKLAEAGVASRWGHMYAPRAIESLKVRKEEGICRISLAHYNTVDEIDRIIDVLESI